jgi:hypothetical protein
MTCPLTTTDGSWRHGFFSVGDDDFAPPRACGRPPQPDQIKDVRRKMIAGEREINSFLCASLSIVAGSYAEIRVSKGAWKVRAPTWCGKAP